MTDASPSSCCSTRISEPVSAVAWQCSRRLERPGSWRVWVDGSPVTKPIHLRGSSGRWAPIATAESFDGGESGCNTFAFRFERVSVSYDHPGGSWRPFVPGYRFLDNGHKLQSLAEAPHSEAPTQPSPPPEPAPYAFVASS